MSLTCELSGEPLTATDAVVTPSGHVCLKRLLLSKLLENGGKDPFVVDGDRPLSEDDLIALKLPPSQVIPPRPGSFTTLLSTMAQEYDALVLELFDTRKALEETRQELSQALYQNDAAVRVVARMASERDAARQALAEYKASGGGTATQEEAVEEEGPPSKKLKVDESMLPLINDIPQGDLDEMIKTWESLHKGRKALLKNASSPADFDGYKLVPKKWHKTKCKGVNALAVAANLVLTAGTDKELILYDKSKDSVAQTVSFSGKVTSVSVSSAFLAAGSSDGHIKIFSVSDITKDGSVHVEGKSDIVNVSLHPDGAHLVAATQSGSICLYRTESGLQAISVLTSTTTEQQATYTCGALHPDGLIYVVGSASGELFIYDMKSKSMAATLKEGDDNDAVTAVAVSENGYHIAAAYGSAKVRVWDLRKQKCTATLSDDAVTSVESVAFDASGKYLAYGGVGGIRVTKAKEWEVSASFDAKEASGLSWAEGGVLVAVSKKQREVGFYTSE